MTEQINFKTAAYIVEFGPGTDVTLALSEVNLSGLLEQITGKYTPIFEKEQLLVQKSIPQEHVPVLMDIEKMVRVYDNLFINALKYSRKPS